MAVGHIQTHTHSQGFFCVQVTRSTQTPAALHPSRSLLFEGFAGISINATPSQG